MAYGLPFQVRHATLVEAAERVLRAAQARGVLAGIPPVSPEDMQQWEARGMRFFEVASAEGLLTEAAKKCAERYASCVEQPVYEASRGD